VIDDDSDDDEPDEGSNDALVFHTEKDVFKNRQHHVEEIKENCDVLCYFIFNPPDMDQSGDYTRVRVGEKRSFEEFIDEQLNEIDKPIIAANNILSELEKHRRKLRHTKKTFL
jgi:hypothetical protein